MRSVPRNEILVGDSLKHLRTLPSASVDCVVTSPPYYALRDYQVPGQIGLEPHVDKWVEHLRAVMREVRRVLKPSGSVWLNLGDSYSRKTKQGARPKSLLLGPERVVLALQAENWIVRNKIVWAKPNPMPASADDRLTCTWEAIYLLVQGRRPFFDLDVIRRPHRSTRAATKPKFISKQRPYWAGPLAGSNNGLAELHARGLAGHPLGANPGDVWTVAKTASRFAHHAIFPEALIERPIKATCPERVCESCGQPWRRAHVARDIGHLAVIGHIAPTCECRAAWRPGVVLDPFMGTGTTALVARRLGRDWLGIELSPSFAALAKERLSGSEREAEQAA
jgi:site-specific DNA-methyltransferase (adenine-specific)